MPSGARDGPVDVGRLCLDGNDRSLHAAIIGNANLDATGSPVRWRHAAGGWQLWFASTQNGFQIVRLDPRVYPVRAR